VQNTKWLMMFVVAVAFFCQGQNQTINSPTIDRHALMTLEDSVANQFASMRKSSGLRKLTRIKNRTQLRQMVCTAAVNEGFKRWGTVIYETNDLSTPNVQLEQLAKFDAPVQKPPTVITDSSVGSYRTGGMPKIERFAVAVWPSKNPNSHWVGIGLYWGGAWEWFDLHLTDDMYDRNEWKKNIAPECKKIK
jgi:hypothetical protein